MNEVMFLVGGGFVLVLFLQMVPFIIKICNITSSVKIITKMDQTAPFPVWIFVP